MDPNYNGANILTSEEIDELFRDDDEQETPPANDNPATSDTVDDTSASDGTDAVDTTKAFSRRLKESTEKARREEREAIAKSLGYDSYEALRQAQEKKMFDDRGLDAEEVAPLVNEIVEQRLREDPRMEELSKLRAKQVEEFGRQELAEITRLTNGKITSLAQLPKEVIDLWKKKGSLKAAYLELEGERLITELRSEHSKGSTAHMNTPSTTSNGSSGKRTLTAEERNMYKFFNPGMKDEDLDKITVDT